MLNKTGSYINELLANDEDFIKYEEKISNLLPKKLANDNFDYGQGSWRRNHISEKRWPVVWAGYHRS